MTEAAVSDDFPKLEKYELLEEIGHGGMATVYRARDVRLGREVAVKIIHRHLRDNREVGTRFIAEGRAAAKLKHKGIVEVYDVSSEDDRERYLVAELVRGATLRKVLVDHREMPAEIGAAIVAELCDALDHAHASGIIHRDIKPENVLIGLPRSALGDGNGGDSLPPTSGDDRRPSGPHSAPTPVPAEDADEIGPSQSAARSVSQPVSSSSGKAPVSKAPRSRPKDELIIKITDFGIAKILDAHGVTSTGQVLGSPAHMAPEQIESGDVDARTDVFALGVVLYEALVGHLPFDGKNPAQVLRRVLEGRYERADLERPTVGGRFSSIIDKALALDISERPESPAALGAELREELEALGITDGRKEIALYFKDPEAYTAALRDRLVPVLVARGEAARRAKKTAEAASDFNRAHALAPDDVAILKRMTQLGSSTPGSRVPARVAMVAALCVGLGGAAYGAARFWRATSAELEPTPDGPIAASSADSLPVVRNPILATPQRTETSALPSASVAALATETAHASAEPEVASKPPAPSASASAAVAGSSERRVLFLVSPRGATLDIGGVPYDHAQNIPYTLKVGTYSAKLTPSPGDKSCEPPSGPISFTVRPLKDGERDQVEKISLSLKFRPAKVKLVAPAGGQAVCGAFTLSGGDQEIPMTGPVWEGSCKFILGGQEKSAAVSLKAGEANLVAWPLGS